jgi:hypothetical protein
MSRPQPVCVEQRAKRVPASAYPSPCSFDEHLTQQSGSFLKILDMLRLDSRPHAMKWGLMGGSSLTTVFVARFLKHVLDAAFIVQHAKNRHNTTWFWPAARTMPGAHVAVTCCAATFYGIAVICGMGYAYI